MAIRDVLVSLDAGPAAEGRMRLAMALAGRHQARLTAMFTLPVPRSAVPVVGRGPVPPSAPPSDPAATAGPPRDPERAEEIERRFRADLRSRGIDGEWYLLDPRHLTDFVEFANCVDLTILGQQSSDAEADGRGIDPDAVIIEVGRPVLVVPYAGRFAAVGRRPLIAWDGTREAARALGDALPLLEHAEAATVVYIGAREARLEQARPALDQLVRHLQRHQIKASAEAAPRGDIPVSDLLLSRAADLGADLIVAGAYHHSPLREALLGGVSRELLRHMTVPVLMSH